VSIENSRQVLTSRNIVTPVKRGRLTTLVVLLGIGAMVILYNYFYPTYSYRYRLTVNVEVDGKVHSGSSVVEVTWRGHPEIPEAGSYSPELRGQAALVDLGSHGVVVGLLLGEDWGEPSSSTGGWGALWIVPRAFGVRDWNDGLPDLVRLRGKRDLAPNNLPRFLWFSNPQDPATAQIIPAQDFQAVLSPSVRFAGASVEITNDPLVIDIRDKLPWLKSLEQKPPGEDIIYLPNKLGVSRYLFIGDRS
jgi:hypothetical protein